MALYRVRHRRPQKAYRLRKTETLFSPAAAASRLAEMERVDPEGLWTFVEGHTHNKFNGAHCVSRTQGFVIGPHDDSGAPGALETVLLFGSRRRRQWRLREHAVT